MIEHLGSADTMIVRRRPSEALQAHAHGTPPPGVDHPAAYRRRGFHLTLARGSGRPLAELAAGTLDT